MMLILLIIYPFHLYAILLSLGDTYVTMRTHEDSLRCRRILVCLLNLGLAFLLRRLTIETRVKLAEIRVAWLQFPALLLG